MHTERLYDNINTAALRLFTFKLIFRIKIIQRTRVFIVCERRQACLQNSCLVCKLRINARAYQHHVCHLPYNVIMAIVIVLIEFL